MPISTLDLHLYLAWFDLWVGVFIDRPKRRLLHPADSNARSTNPMVAILDPQTADEQALKGHLSRLTKRCPCITGGLMVGVKYPGDPAPDCHACNGTGTALLVEAWSKPCPYCYVDNTECCWFEHESMDDTDGHDEVDQDDESYIGCHGTGRIPSITLESLLAGMWELGFCHFQASFLEELSTWRAGISACRDSSYVFNTTGDTMFHAYLHAAALALNQEKE